MGDFVLLESPGNDSHTDEQQQEEEKRSAAEAAGHQLMPREMKIMGATKNLQTIRQKNGIEREVPRQEQDNVKQRTKGVSRTGGAAAQVHFATEPLKDARLEAMNPTQKFSLR